MAGIDDIFYTSATTGETVSLNSDGLFFGTALEMRGYSFDGTLSLNGYDNPILKPVEATVEVTVYDRTEWDILRRLAVSDMYAGKQGTFTVLDKLGNEWTRNGNIRADSLKSLPADVLTTDMSIVLYGCWEKQSIINFLAEDASTTDSMMLDYPYDFPFDYGFSQTNNTIELSGSLPAHATIRIYGYCVNPRIRIGHNTYGVDTTIGVGEKVEIDTKKKTVKRIVNDGTNITEINEYPHRVKGNETTGNYIFHQLYPNDTTVQWDASFSFEVIVRRQEVETPWIL